MLIFRQLVLHVTYFVVLGFQADASKSGPAPPKTPIEAFERLKINVTVQGLVEKYWKNDIQSVAHRQSGNKFFKSNKPAEAIKAYSEAIDLGRLNKLSKNTPARHTA